MIASLTLRRAVSGDVAVLRRLFTDADRTLDRPGALPSQWLEQQMTDPHRALWMVVVQSRAVGLVGMRNIDLEPGCAEAWYVTDPIERGKGVATRALMQATTIMHDFGLHRIEVRCEVGHVASIRVAERAGFVHEGTLRMLRFHDTFRDYRLLSHLRDA